MATRGNTSGVVVGIDIGATKTSLLVTNMNGETQLARRSFDTSVDIGPSAMIDQMHQALNELLGEAGVEQSSLRAVGVSVPGPVDPTSGTVLMAGNLRGWRNLPLQEQLRERLGVPVVVEHDGACGALGEKWRGAARSLDDFVFLALGTGVGAGVMIRGELYRGANFRAGEVGNFLMGRSFLGRNRKGRGNLEQLIGSRALREAAFDSAGEPMDAASVITKPSDARVREIIERTSDYLAITVVGIASLLDPKAIIFGGGTLAGAPEMVERVQRVLRGEIDIVPELIPAALGEDSQLYGAIHQAAEALNASGKLKRVRAS